MRVPSRDITSAVLLRCRGKTYAEIGDALGWGVSTIHQHLNLKKRKRYSNRQRKWAEDRRPQLRAKNKAYYEQNQERERTRGRAYVLENKEIIAVKKAAYRRLRKRDIAEYGRRWREKNKQHIRDKKREKRKTDVQYKMQEILRSRLQKAVTRGQKNRISS